MHIFISTRETQGQRSTDFDWTDIDEMVIATFECDRDVEADGPCGCKRLLSGVRSHKGTTTFKVADDPRTIRQLRRDLALSYRNARWGSEICTSLIERTLAFYTLAAALPLGTICERRDHEIWVRHTP